MTFPERKISAFDLFDQHLHDLNEREVALHISDIRTTGPGLPGYLCRYTPGPNEPRFRSCSGVCGGKDVEGDHKNKAFDLREAGPQGPKGIAPLCEA